MRTVSKKYKKAKKSVITGDIKIKIDAWVEKFPDDQKQSAVLSALRIVQKANEGYLTESLMDEVADYLGMSGIAVYEVATFYTMYDHKPVGKNKIEVCTNLSCQLCGSSEIIAHLEQRLNIKMGEVTKDRKFSLHAAECLGACTGAPMLQIGDKYHENLTRESVDALLDELT